MSKFLSSAQILAEKLRLGKHYVKQNDVSARKLRERKGDATANLEKKVKKDLSARKVLNVMSERIELYKGNVIEKDGVRYMRLAR